MAAPEFLSLTVTNTSHAAYIKTAHIVSVGVSPKNSAHALVNLVGGESIEVSHTYAAVVDLLIND